MTKILYFLSFIGHKRAYESLKDIDGVEQVVLGPKPRAIDGMLEDYSRFGISKIITYSDKKEAQRIIDKFNPDIFVRVEALDGIIVSKGCKKVLIGHGLIGDHVSKMILSGLPFSGKGADLYCDADGWFERNVKIIDGNTNAKFVQNALPQLDLLHDPDYYTPNRSKIISSSNNSSPEKVILFCGFGCKDRVDFKNHNENYFETIAELERIVEKNNWLVMIKPRQEFKKTMNFLNSTSSLAKYKKIYPSLVKSKNLHFISYDNNVYKYFFADSIVINGCSSIELEACIAGKPLVIVRTRTKADYDPFKTVFSGAAFEVKRICDLESTIISSLKEKSYIQKQKDLLKSRGMIVDGLAHQRAQSAILGLIKIK